MTNLIYEGEPAEGEPGAGQLAPVLPVPATQPLGAGQLPDSELLEIFVKADVPARVLHAADDFVSLSFLHVPVSK